MNFITIAHTEADFYRYEKKDRKRKKLTIRIHDPVLEGAPLKIPISYWEYNHHIGITDQYTQLETSYTIYHCMRRN
jgi:hypothetical protein